MQVQLFLLLATSTVAIADDCKTCLSSGGRWCLDQNTPSPCLKGSKLLGILANLCSQEIRNPQNCPMQPAAGYGYDEDFARNIVTPYIAAVYVSDPTPCLRKQVPTATFYKSIRVQCRNGGPKSTCHAYVAYDQSKKAIVVVFEGTDGRQQWIDEISSFFTEKEPFFNNGNVYAYFYNAFYYLWNGGLEIAVRNLKSFYPDYELWAFGHSLGASICTVFASHAVKTNLFVPQKVKLVTFGQPRTGDKNFANWHDNTFLYSYRVVHKQDPVPHVPPMLGPDEVFHHRYEVWYNNSMKVGEPYTVCQEADGMYCSNTQLENNWDDHVVYFDKEITDSWPSAGCP